MIASPMFHWLVHDHGVMITLHGTCDRSELVIDVF